MIITQSRVISAEPYLADINPGDSFYIVSSISADNIERLDQYGFDINSHEQQELVPRPIKGSTHFNAEGKWQIHKDLPKEMRTFEREYHCVDWHGTHHFGTCFQSRMCYQRTRIPPLSIPLTFRDNLLLSPLLTNLPESYEKIKVCINMLLEIIGICETRGEDLVGFIPPIPIRTVPWTILPIGRYPWNEARERLRSVIEGAKPNIRIVINNRHEHIWTHQPDFIARGEAGFWGYIVYGFTNRNIYVFESNQLDNATYVFEGDWETASRLTKADIICGNLQRDRIIHSESWRGRVNDLFR